MKDFSVNDIRNVGLIGHQSVGKSTLAEALAFSTGVTNRLGSIDEGSTISDYRSDEIERKISISASLLQLTWKKNKFNVIDMPGYPDFIGEVRCGLKVSDLAVMVIGADSGPEVGTELAWDIVKEYNTPTLFFVNQEDKDHANFNKTLAALREAYGNDVSAIQFPVNEGVGFNSIIDLLQMKKISFKNDLSGQYTLEEIPSDLVEKANAMKNTLIEKIAESDDELLEKYFETEELDDQDILKGLRSGIVAGTLYPVLCGAAVGNIGTHLLLDFIAEYGPSPQSRPKLVATNKDGDEIEIQADENKPFCGQVFKTLSELHVGELSLVRVFAGSLKSGDEVFNTTRRSSEKIGQIYTLNGKNRNEMGILKAGDIGSLVKLKNTHTGNTLADKKTQVTFSDITFPEPVVDLAVVPRSKGDEDKISSGLNTLHEIDPSFGVYVDPELKQTVISGQGEMHLIVIIQRLKDRYGVEVDQKKPKIPYRETITTKADEKYRHKKQTGGAGQFAEVWMRIEPLPRGQGFEFESKVVGGAISSVFIPSVEKGVVQIMAEGAVAGYKIVDVKATVYDGKEHPVDSKDIAFQIAGREVFKMAVLNAKPILLEPIYNVAVRCPEQYMGDVMGDLSSRRGKILGMESQGRFQIVNAQVPLAELHNYATTLRSISHGRATHTRSLSHYDPVPRELETKIIEESKAERDR